MSVHAKSLNQLVAELNHIAQMRKTQEQHSAILTKEQQLQVKMDEMFPTLAALQKRMNETQAQKSELDPAPAPAKKSEPPRVSFAKSSLGGGFAGKKVIKAMEDDEPFYMDSSLGTRFRAEQRAELRKSARGLHFYPGFASRTAMTDEDDGDY